jgi:hypothetical protein
MIQDEAKNIISVFVFSRFSLTSDDRIPAAPPQISNGINSSTNIFIMGTNLVSVEALKRPRLKFVRGQ